MSSQSDDEKTSAFRPFTKAERIQQLNDIDRGITQLLQSTALALKTLSSVQTEPVQTPANRREAFKNASNTFLNTLQKVDIGLKRQILGLEEANIIMPDKIKSGGVRANIGGDPNSGAGAVGKLDIGWLNSRSGRVGRDMEAELWGKAKDFLENLEKGKIESAVAAEESQDVEMT